MKTCRLIYNSFKKVLQKVKNNIRPKDLFSAGKWRYWVIKARQEVERARLELDQHPDRGKFCKQPSLDMAHYRFHRLRQDWYQLLHDRSESFAYKPRFSIIMPVYNTEEKWLRQAIDSVIAQVYPFWELCIADDASTNPDTLETLKEYSKVSRITVIHRKTNGNISRASNNAAEMASGDYLIFMDHDDLIAPHALFDIAEILQINRDAEIIYSDENKVTGSGHFYDTHFKPDWSPTLLLSYNYINHLVCMSKALFKRVNGFREGYDGAQDYDLLLRSCFQCQKILHIPKVLYHWRAVSGSTAKKATDKPEMAQSAYQAIKDHLVRNKLNVHAYEPSWSAIHKLPVYQLDGPDKGPLVDIIIPTHNHGKLLHRCVNAITQKTTYQNYRIIIIDNESDHPETLAIFQHLRKNGIRVETIYNDEKGFSFARICNKAVDLSDSEYLLFLNDDTEVITKRWLSRMMAYMSLPDVGVVGARLLFPDNTIQHAGVTLQMNDGIAPAHAFHGISHHELTYFFMGRSARECSAVTGACLLTSKKLFQELGGFDERHYRISLNDVDYCLRVWLKAHQKCVYVPEATLIHHESATRNTEDDPVELAHFNRVYGHYRDPFYNPNLSKLISFRPFPASNQLSYVRYLNRPLKVLLFTHNLNLEGASRVVTDLAEELSSIDTIATKLISFMEGPLKDKSKVNYEGKISICRLPGNGDILTGWASRKELEVATGTVRVTINNEKPDVVIANVLNNFFVVNAALKLKIPVVWIIHESYSKRDLINFLPPFAIGDFELAIRQANRVVFVSRETRSLYEHYNQWHHFTTIHNALKSDCTQLSGLNKEEAHLRQELGLLRSQKIILTVGTICQRKDQTTLVQAAARLARIRQDFICILVGARQHDLYFDRLCRLVKKLNVSDHIIIVDETPGVHQYYQAADIFAFTSLNESYSLTILEAMAFGLPIVTTPCIGISEQVRFNVNALPFAFSDEKALAGQLEKLLDDPALTAQMGRNSKNIWRYLPAFDDMIDQYRKLVKSVAQEGMLESV